MKLELKHLAPYLPYKLQLRYCNDDLIYELTSLSKPYKTNNKLFLTGEYKPVGASYKKIRSFINSDDNEFKPILRNLSDLTKKIEVNGKKFVPMDEFWQMFGGGYNESAQETFIEDFLCEIKLNVMNQSFGVIQKLHEWHFDTQNLIENNLAVDINTLK